MDTVQDFVKDPASGLSNLRDTALNGWQRTLTEARDPNTWTLDNWQRAWNDVRGGASLGLDLIPVIGDIKGVIEGLVGYDLAGNKLSKFEQSVAIAGALLGMFTIADELVDAGKLLRHVANNSDFAGDMAKAGRGLGHVDELAETAGLGRHVDEALDTATSTRLRNLDAFTSGSQATKQSDELRQAFVTKPRGRGLNRRSGSLSERLKATAAHRKAGNDLNDPSVRYMINRGLGPIQGGSGASIRGPRWDKNVKRWRNPETGRFVKSPDSVEMLTDPDTGLALPKEYIEAIETLGISRREMFDSYSENYRKGVDFETFINDYVASNPHGVNRLDAHTIFGYTTKLFYKRLNIFLREGKNVDQTAAIKKLINNALQKMPTISGTHFRGIELSGEMLEDFIRQHSSGDPVLYGDFISAANNKQRWWEDYNVRIRIEPKNARDISDLAFGVNFQDKVGLGPNYPQESLIMSESEFDVDDIISEVEDGQTVYNIWLTQTK